MERLSLSIVVVVHNLRREAARTLFSLTVPYQRDIAAEDYEVIVVDDGSTERLDPDWVAGCGPTFRYLFREADSPSPAAALHTGIGLARHECLGLFVDGGRIASPGLLSCARKALASAERAIVASPAWQLGPERPWASLSYRYDREAEDGLLAESNWEKDGYGLFSISTLAASSMNGYFHPPAESGALFLRRVLYEEIGGLDERLAQPDGRVVGADLLRRACTAEGTELVVLLGEGTFRQIHGGLAGREHDASRRVPFEAPRKSATHLGILAPQAIGALALSMRRLAPDQGRVARTPVTVPVLFCIDSENDESGPGRFDPSPWIQLERCFERLEAYRPRLAETTGTDAAFNWFVRADPQVEDLYGDSAWGLAQYRRTWQELQSRGDSIGLHPHAQRWSEEHQEWVGGQAAPGWAAHVLEVAVESYRRVLARGPESLRFGNRFMSQELAVSAAALGLRYDLSTEPGYPGRSGTIAWQRAAGSCPSYFELPREPYRPSRDNYQVPDPERTSGMWFIPMSAAPINDEPPRSDRPHHRAVSPHLYPYETLLLRLSPELFRRAVDHLIYELARPYLAVVIRSDMIDLPEVWANLEMLRTHAWARHFVFTTPGPALRMLGYERAARPAG